MNDAQKRLSDDFQPTFPCDGIVCKACVFRKSDLVEDGKIIVKGCKNGCCEVCTKEFGKGKQTGILFCGEKCKYYMKEDE